MVETAGTDTPIALRKVKFRLFNMGAEGETGDLMSRTLKLIAIFACATLVVAACGKRGSLQPPAQDPGAYAKPGKKDTAHRSNPLDGLLR